ncbi:MAG: DMT family transporter [Bacteroidales bacterium]|nr:DMT family transporter [Bacteroidales bacterium]
MNESKGTWTYLSLLLAMGFWGMSFIWYKQAFPHFGPFSIIWIRMISSAPLLLGAALLLKRLRWPRLRDLKAFFLLALFEPFFYFIGESLGLMYISSTLAAILIATIPLITPFVGYYFFKEKLTANNYLGILVSFAGVVMVVYAEGIQGDAPWYGILLILLAVLSTQGYAVSLKKLSAEYNALSIVWFQNLLGGIYFFPLYLIFESKEQEFFSLSLADYLPVIYLSIFASAIAFVFFVQGIKSLGITRATVFTNFIPVITAIFASFILNEKMGLLKGAGIFIAIIGLFMSQAAGFPKIRIFSRVR